MLDVSESKIGRFVIVLLSLAVSCSDLSERMDLKTSHQSSLIHGGKDYEE